MNKKSLVIMLLSVGMIFYSCSEKTDTQDRSVNYCSLPPSFYENGNYYAHKVYQEPVIDGQDLENGWLFTPWQSISDTLKWGFDGRYKVLWEESKLYFQLSVHEKDFLSKYLVFQFYKKDESENKMTYKFNVNGILQESGNTNLYAIQKIASKANAGRRQIEFTVNVPKGEGLSETDKFYFNLTNNPGVSAYAKYILLSLTR